MRIDRERIGEVSEGLNSVESLYFLRFAWVGCRVSEGLNSVERQLEPELRCTVQACFRRTK